MITQENFTALLEILGYTHDITGSFFTYNFETCSMSADLNGKKLIYPPKVQGRERNSGFDANENFVVFECVHRLLMKGYAPEDIHLEKAWQLGRSQKGGRADICVYKKGSDDVLMIIECKTYGGEYTKALNDTRTDGAQLFSYWQQESSTEWLVLYTSDIKDGAITYSAPAIDCKDDSNLLKRSGHDDTLRLYVNAHTAQEKFTAWRETYNLETHEGVIFSDESTAYDIGTRPLRKKDLKPLTDEDKKGIINAFEEILRHNNVSDKENAFNRLIALFICKLVDEIRKGDDDELSFHYMPRRDSYEDLQDRLQKLYHEGMSEFMKEEITYIPADYPELLFSNYKGRKRSQAIRELSDAFRKLKYFTNNDFAFKDVHNEELFYQNGKILVEVVQLFQRYRIVHNDKNQLLGDLFEQLLDKGFRQNEGQFFTPIVITRFIWDCLPLGRYKTCPKVIDYACGAGHFLTEAVEAVNYFIRSEDNSWVRDCIYGIEKDYRLARVSKVSMFMNGAGDSNIIFGDGLENTPAIKPGTFDILTANPPYSVASFRQHLSIKNNSFDLLGRISPNSSEIEVLFVERIGQLLKSGGIAAVILPSSILSNDSASYTGAREEILRNFKLRAIVKLGSKTFGATGTNTVILFLERYPHHPPRTMHVHDSVDAILDGRDLTDWEDEDILTGYLDMQGLTREQWEGFIHGRLEFADMPEYFRGYLEAWKTQDEREFYDRARKVEREKLFYYGLTYSQRTVIILAPSDNAGQKEFLGYDWSNRKGDEGIKFSGARGGKLYDNDNRGAEGTLAHVVRQSFSDGDIEMTEDNARFSRVVRTSDMLDFSRAGFNAAMNLQPELSIELPSKYPMQTIGKVLTLEYGKGLPASKRIAGEYPVLGSNGRIGTHNTFWVKGPVIIIGRTGSAGAVTWEDEDCYPIDTTYHVQLTSDKVLLRYVYYVFQQMDFASLNNKMGVPCINRDDVYKLKIPLPPMDIQAQIVSECSGIDAQESSLNAGISTCRGKIDELFREVEDLPGASLASVLEPITDRVNTSILEPHQYVTTDTMLQKCGGIRPYTSTLPLGSVIQFRKGDILLSNIRPYLRKLWLADFDGGCSPDVLVFRSRDDERCAGKFAYYAMRQEKFFDYVMQDVKGMKMPRGKREHILDYVIPLPPREEQERFLDEAADLEEEISEKLRELEGLAGMKEAVLRSYLG